MSGLLSLKWNHHSRIFLHLLQNLRVQELYCDTTIVCQGKFYPVHKLVLSTCSEYFKEIFERSPCKHPFIILRDVQPLELEALLNYMYKGEVDVLQDTLSELVKTAEALQIKGLAVSDDEARDYDASQMEQSNSTQESFNDRSTAINNQETVINESERDLLETSEQNNEEKRPIDHINHHSNDEDTGMPNRSPVSVRSASPAEDQILNHKLLKVEFNEGSGDVPIKDEKCDISMDEIESFDTSKSDAERSVKNALNLWNEQSSAGPSGEQNFVVHDVVSLHTNPPKKKSESKPSVYDHLLKTNLSPHQIGNLFTCPVCGLGSTHRTSMKRHILRKHTLERPYGCDFCSYRAATKDTVVEHTIRLHSNNVFKCSYCSYNTKLRRFLIRHIKKVHQIPEVPKEHSSQSSFQA